MSPEDKSSSSSAKRLLGSPFQSPKSVRLSASRFTRWLVVGLLCIVVFISFYSTNRTPNMLSRDATAAGNSIARTSGGGSYDRKVVGQPEKHHVDLTGGVEETRILAHVPGFTVMDNLYVRNQTMYIVSDNPEELPALALINKGPPDEGWDYDYNSSHIQTITTAEAKSLFGPRAARMDGVSFLWKDNFIAHFAHFALESLLGSWKVYSAAVNPYGTEVLPFPRRFILMWLDEEGWRDSPSMNSFVIKSAFPGMATLYQLDWEERGVFGLTDVYDRVILVDRSAAHHYTPENKVANKVIGGVRHLPTAPDFWQPVRNSILESLPPSPEPAPTKPVVTYISRQGVKGRKLITADHDNLVKALRQLEASGRAEVHVAQFERMARHEQVLLASKTNIMMSLHGNGLTHLLWMPPRSTLIEFQWPYGWSCDFFYPATAIGHRYYSVLNETIVRGEEMPPEMNMPEGYHGNSIPLGSAAVLRVITDLLDGREPPPHNTTIRGS